MRNKETLTVVPGIFFDYIRLEDYKNASFSIGFKYKVKRGCSSADAILSRLLLRSSRDYPSQLLFSRRLEELYSTEVTVRSRRNGDFRLAVYTALFLDEPYAREIPDFTRTVLSFLAGAIFCPALENGKPFPLEQIEQEKTLLLDQIRGIKNGKNAYAQKRLNEITSDPKRYDVPDYGTIEEAEGITPAVLRRRYRDMLSRSEIRFAYAGSLPKETVLGLIRSLFASVLTERPPLAGAACMPPRPLHRPALRVREETNGKQAILGIVYRLPIGTDEPESEKLYMLSAILSDLPMSLLFSEVREKGGYCYSINGEIRREKRDLQILCGIEPGSEHAVERAVARVIASIRAGKTDQTLISSAVSYLETLLTSTWEDVESMVDHVILRGLFGRTTDAEELLRQWRGVTPDSLADLTRGLRLDAVYLLTPKGGENDG